MADDEKAPHTRALLNDLANAEHDVLSLAERHGLSLEALVAWSQRPETRRALAGLCVLADAQAQVLLSRYRLVAATRLITQVTAEANALPPEQVRKACVDLLKTDLSRLADFAPTDDADEDADLDALREALSAGANQAQVNKEPQTDDPPT
jgi:hypothetical protein